jgi:uncharacterized protein (TIGR03435 family)
MGGVTEAVDWRMVRALICAVALWGASAHLLAHAQSPAPPTAGVYAPMDAVPANISFDVVSFKRCPEGRFGTAKVDMPMTADYLAYHCEPLSRIIYFAYTGSLRSYTLESGYPPWVDNDRYEFIVKVAAEDFPAWQKLDLTARRVLIRKVLADTVKLKIRVDNSPKDIYALTATKKVKLTPYKDGDETKLPGGIVQTGRTFNWIHDDPSTGYMTIHLQGTTMANLAEILSVYMDRAVADHTNLTGPYIFALPLGGNKNMEPDSHLGGGEDAPTIEDGLEQLGLRLEPAKGPDERLVIDHIEKPEED